MAKDNGFEAAYAAFWAAGATLAAAAEAYALAGARLRDATEAEREVEAMPGYEAEAIREEIAQEALAAAHYALDSAMVALAPIPVRGPAREALESALIAAMDVCAPPEHARG
jgi:hypothetical protein